MLNNDEIDHSINSDGNKAQWTCFAVLALILSIASLIIFLIMQPELASTETIILFTTQFIAAGIVRLTLWTRNKHQNQTAIILATLALLVVAVFAIFFFKICILTVFKDFTEIYKP